MWPWPANGASPPPEPVRTGGRRALESAGWDGRARRVSVHPGAGGLVKRWPAAGFAAALRRFLDGRRAAAVLTEGPADRDAVSAMRAELGDRASVLAHPSLVDLAGALACARVYIGNDSGVSHLAASVGVPAVVLFDGANVAWRPWSRSARQRVVQPRSVTEADVAAVTAALE